MSDIKDKQDRIQVKHGQYYALKQDQMTGSSYYSKISNFTLTVDRCFINTETGDIAREIFLDGPGQKRVGPFLCESETALAPAKFAAFCFSKGVFFFEGGKKDLLEIWKRESTKARVFIQESPYVGHLPRFGLYLFEDLAISADGARYAADNHIFTVDHTTALTFRRFAGAAGRLPTMADGLHGQVTLADLEGMLYDSIGNRGLLALSWVALVAFLPYITAKFRRFPHLFISGKTQSGKTTLASWMMACFGIFAEGLSIKDTTIYAINEMLAYYSGLPVWLDEYRTRDLKCIEKNDFLKNAYDRQGSMKGRLNRQWEEIPINGALLLTGEEFPDVHSVLSRCICLELSQKQHTSRQAFEDLNSLQKYFPGVLLELLHNITPHTIRAFFKYQYIVERDILPKVKDNRIAFNYSLLLAAFRVFVDAKNDTFTQWLIQYAVRDRQTKEQDKFTTQFLTDVVGLIEDDLIDDKLYCAEAGRDENGAEIVKLYLALEPIYRQWEKEMRLRGSRSTYAYKTLVRDLKDEPFYVDEEKGKFSQKFIHGQRRRCICFNIEKLPLSLREDFENFTVLDTLKLCGKTGFQKK